MAERSRSRSVARRLRLKLHTDLHQRLDGLHAGLADLRERVLGLHTAFGDLNARLDGIEAEVRRDVAISRHLYDEEPANRRRLQQLRRSEEYKLAFSEDEPLVSFIVPTYQSFETLRDVALPSIG